MATLLTNAAANTVGNAVEMAGPCTVYCRGSISNAAVIIQVSRTGDESDFVSEHTFYGPGQINIEGKGTYHIRAKTNNAGAGVSVTVEAVN